MIKLFLDIETLPGDESVRADIAGQARPPATLSRPEAVRRWEEEAKPQEVERRYRDTALQGHIGRILCIGYIKETPSSTSEGVLRGDEHDILRRFWDVAADVDLFIGFNIFDFDLKFILQRSIVQRVRPSRQLSFARYRNNPIYDVMHEWELWRGYISLDALARALGISSPKGELDGSRVYDYYRAGRQDEIYAYCLNDVRATREIYNRMGFVAETQAEAGSPEDT